MHAHKVKYSYSYSYVYLSELRLLSAQVYIYKRKKKNNKKKDDIYVAQCDIMAESETFQSLGDSLSAAFLLHVHSTFLKWLFH